LTGYVALGFVVVHLMKFRFAHVFGWGPEFIHEGNNFFEITRRGLMHWQPWGFQVPAAATLTLYTIGLLASVFHFCNGIWSFCISWGIAVGERAQRGVGYAATGVALVLLTWGGLSLYAFASAPPGASIRVETVHSNQPAPASFAGVEREQSRPIR
jgi:succinate dehydrogenase / fumarate reductase cytochrome b subunit